MTGTATPHVEPGWNSGRHRILSGMPHKEPKRRRATQQEMQDRRLAVLNILQKIKPASVRQTFYQASVQGLTDKTEDGYEKVQRTIVWLRECGICPFGWISDATRWMRKPDTYSSIEAALRETIETYRRAVWRDENIYVEVWIEKDALAGTILPVTSQYDVPLMVARGYSSLTFLHAAAAAIAARRKPAFIYHLGDWDPSGQDAARHIEAKLRKYAPGVPIHFERLAVSEQQIFQLELPTRPTKKSDSRSKAWKGGSVELDAIDPGTLRKLVREAIERHISPQRLAVIEAAEKSEREIAATWIKLARGEEGKP
jgi:hypothetical protein